MNIKDQDKIEIKGKKVVVLGLALSGVSAAKLAIYKGASVFVSDQGNSQALTNSFNILKKIGSKGELGKHSDKIYDAELWVISPGIPQNSKLIQNARAKKNPYC